MKNIDSRIINMLEYAKKSIEKEKREKSLNRLIIELKNGYVKVNNLDLKLYKNTFFDNKIKIFIPKTFKLMSERNIKLKYPNDARPSIIYTNKEDTINIGLNYINADVDENMTVEFKNVMKTSYINVDPTAKILDEDDFFIGDKKIAYYSFNNIVGQEKMYNLIFNLSLYNRPFVCNFNCLEEDREKYEVLFYGIMKTIEFI